MSEQERLVEPAPEPADDETVYVVATNYADDPHPHIEGVFSDAGPAQDLMRDCRKITEAPNPVAWELFEAEVDGEVTLL